MSRKESRRQAAASRERALAWFGVSVDDPIPEKLSEADYRLWVLARASEDSLPREVRRSRELSGFVKELRTLIGRMRRSDEQTWGNHWRVNMHLSRATALHVVHEADGLSAEEIAAIQRSRVVRSYVIAESTPSGLRETRPMSRWIETQHSMKEDALLALLHTIEGLTKDWKVLDGDGFTYGSPEDLAPPQPGEKPEHERDARELELLILWVRQRGIENPSVADIALAAIALGRADPCEPVGFDMLSRKWDQRVRRRAAKV